MHTTKAARWYSRFMVAALSVIFVGGGAMLVVGVTAPFQDVTLSVKAVTSADSFKYSKSNYAEVTYVWEGEKRLAWANEESTKGSTVDIDVHASNGLPAGGDDIASTPLLAKIAMGVFLGLVLLLVSALVGVFDTLDDAVMRIGYAKRRKANLEV